MATMTPTQAAKAEEYQDTLEQALMLSSAHIIWTKVKLWDAGETKTGKPKRDVSLNFRSNAGDWYTISHSIMGDALDHVARMLRSTAMSAGAPS